MTDHVHEWYFSSASGIFQCKKPRCIVGMGFLRAADKLNEHAELKRENERLEETNKGLFGIVETYHPGYIDGCACPQCSDIPIYFDDVLADTQECE